MDRLTDRVRHHREAAPSTVQGCQSRALWSMRGGAGAGTVEPEKDRIAPVCVCMCAYACVQVCVCSHAHVHMCVHVCVFMSGCTRVCVCMCVHVCVHACVHTYVCVCMCLCVSVCLGCRRAVQGLYHGGGIQGFLLIRSACTLTPPFSGTSLGSVTRAGCPLLQL